MPFDAAKLAADVEAFCQEVRPAEELAYAERKFNDQVVPLAKKHNLLGMNVQPEYGGRGADAVTYFKALGPHRPRGDRRPHLLLRPPQHRRVPDPDVGQRRAQEEVPARRRPRRERSSRSA